jgi:hypothetical protein
MRSKRVSGTINGTAFHVEFFPARPDVLTSHYVRSGMRHMALWLCEDDYGAGGELVELGPNRFEYKVAVVPGVNDGQV